MNAPNPLAAFLKKSALHSLNKFFYYSTYFAVVTTAAYARKKVRRAKWALTFSP
jgi:hypothetical protein